VLVSGSGSNLQALIDCARADPGFGAEIAVVISDRAGVAALDRARAAGIPAAVVEYRGDREDFTRRVCDTADAHDAAALILAGFMRILSPEAMSRYPGRILNVHPSLLPAFPGAGAVGKALAAGVRVSGVTVHFVDEQVDHGPIIAQRPVEVLADDDEASLHARIQEQEHDLYPQVVKALAAGRLAVQDGRVAWT
jgi:phosphoribosylglycinamide formyltransferase-1